MNKTCQTCNFFESDKFYDLGGICLLSQSGESKMMVAHDELSENRPYLEVSQGFGCNQHQMPVATIDNDEQVSVTEFIAVDNSKNHSNSN